VSVKPNMITTSDGLIGYAPNRRQCYFNDERQLKFFKVYTQSNCELECLANFTLGMIVDASHEKCMHNKLIFIIRSLRMCEIFNAKGHEYKNMFTKGYHLL
jgi:hypothetical protein